ncbi:MAG: substrate-binding domain-containing protein, partial [Treponema sp.]|nr:substrate-binding domain-containing protein [Treponema sp.]
DPRRSGSSFTAIMTMNAATGDPEFADRFADQLEGRLLESSGDVLAEVSDGTALAGIALEEAALRKIAEGANIALAYPAEGTSAVPDGTAVVRGTQHPEAAERFLEFTVDRDVQELLPKRFCRRPVLQNVAADTLTAAGLPATETLRLIDYNVQDAAVRQDAVLMSWSFRLGGEVRLTLHICLLDKHFALRRINLKHYFPCKKLHIHFKSKKTGFFLQTISIENTYCNICPQPSGIPCLYQGRCKVNVQN